MSFLARGFQACTQYYLCRCIYNGCTFIIEDRKDVPCYVQDAPDWTEILTHFRGSELQNYFTKILEDDMKAIIKPQYVDQIPRAIKVSSADCWSYARGSLNPRILLKCDLFLPWFLANLGLFYFCVKQSVEKTIPYWKLQVVCLFWRILISLKSGSKINQDGFVWLLGERCLLAVGLVVTWS